MNEAAKQVQRMAEQIQDECHEAVKHVIRESAEEITVQDATNVFLFTKLAELQLQIEQIKQR